MGDVRVKTAGACVGKDAGRTALVGVVTVEAPGEIGDIEEIGDGAYVCSIGG